MVLCNYDTDYFLESVEAIQGRRYNSPAGPDTLIGRNISKDDVAGFFRTLTLTEEEKSILKVVNQFQIADTEMIISGTGLKFNKFKKTKELCILTGLIFENHIKTEEREYFWYMVDTGGIYALDDMGEKYNQLPFTLSLEEKYKLYLKANFVFTVSGYFSMIDYYKVKDRSGQVYNIELLEDVKVSAVPNYKYTNTIFLLNRKTLDLLNIEKPVKNLAKQLNCNRNKFFDIYRKEFLNIIG